MTIPFSETHRSGSKSIKVLVCLFTFVFACSHFCAAQDETVQVEVVQADTVQVDAAPINVFGPRVEIGGGVSGFRLQARPDWSSKRYGTGFITGAFRLLYGLSIQAGKEYGYGQEPYPEWIEYEDGMQISTDKGTVLDLGWAGLRYELPMEVFKKKEALGIDFVHFSAGLVSAKHSIRSNKEKVDDVTVKSESYSNYYIGKTEGYYAGFGARWKLVTDVLDEEEAWLGAFGADLGARYLFFNKSSVSNSLLDKPGNGMNSWQIYITFFYKLKLLY